MIGKVVFKIAALFVLFSTSINAQEKYQKQIDKANKWNAEQFVIIKKNFGFSTGCDTSKIKLTVLQSEMEAVGAKYYGGMGYSNKQKAHDQVAARTVGADGCGQKMSYVYVANTGWVANTTSK